MKARERAAYFDQYVKSVEAVLTQPGVGAALGDLALKLLDINDRAFLPVERDGQLIVPEDYADSYDTVAVVPISEDEAARFPALAAPILSDRGPWKKFDTHMKSPVSGMVLNTKDVLEERRRQISRQPSLRHNTAVEGLGAHTEAKMFGSYVLGRVTSSGEDQWAVARPIVTVKAASLVNLDQYNQAATLAHEYVHAKDMLTHPLLYQTLRGGVASELVGYHVSSIGYGMTLQQVPSRQYTETIESWRQQNMSPDAPFTPSEEQARFLREELGV
jgi:hypothetical protein